jgi:aspartyl aminopeptidase
MAVCKSKSKKKSPSIVQGSGKITHPDNKAGEILFRNTLDEISVVSDLENFTSELEKEVLKFHEAVKFVSQKYGVKVKDFISFEIIEGEVKDGN